MPSNWGQLPLRGTLGRAHAASELGNIGELVASILTLYLSVTPLNSQQIVLKSLLGGLAKPAFLSASCVPPRGICTE